MGVARVSLKRLSIPLIVLTVLIYCRWDYFHRAITQGNVAQTASAKLQNIPLKVRQLPSDLQKQSLLVHPKTEPRILCWILTGVPNHMTRAVHVKRTWGSHCDVLLFMSSLSDEQLGTIALPGVEEGHEKLWPKTVKAFQYVWEHHRDDADWFMKADDDTWVFVDNLRSLLRSYNAKEPHFLGRQGATTHTNATYHYGGTGYLVSREALRLFIEEAVPRRKKCYTTGIRPDFHGWEDAEFGECMCSIPVFPETLFDEKGRHRLLTYNPAGSLRTLPEHSKWKNKLSSTADRPITYHKVKPEDMYVLEYLTNYLKHDR